MVAVVGALVVLLVAAGYWFEPWRLFTTREVDERLPAAAPATAIASAEPGVESRPTAEARPVDVARGRFVSHEHGTSGRCGSFARATAGCCWGSRTSTRRTAPTCTSGSPTRRF